VALWLSSFGDRGPFVIFTAREIRRQLQTGAALGVARLSPGTYETTCGKGLDDCSTDELREIAIKNDAILLFKEGSWGDIIYLDADRTIKIFAHSD